MIRLTPNLISNDTVKSRGIVASGDNIDNYKIPGIYSVTTDDIAQSVQNLPVSISCDFVVFNSRGGNVSYGYGDAQMVVAPTDLYFRVWHNSRWWEWVRLENHSNVLWTEKALEVFNQYNLMKNIGQPYHTDRTNNGIHFRCPLATGFLTWTLDGTATDTASATVLSGQMSTLGLVAGNVYYFNMDECPSGVSWSFRFSSASGNKFVVFTHSNYLVVPSNVTGDVLIQIVVANESAYNNVSFSMPQLTPVNRSILDEFQTWFLRGVILADGSISSSDSRIYTPDMMEFDSDIVISFDETRSVQIMYYDESSVFIPDRNTYGWMDGPNYVVINAGDRFKLNVKLIPNANQSNVQITETLEHVHIYSLKKKLYEDYANYEDDWASLSMYQTISVIGDSYASGPSNNYPMSWGQIMARDIGATMINLSHGGAYTKTWLTNNDWGLTKMLSDPAQQLYICAMGINDYTRIKNNEYTLGTIVDINDASPSSNPDTFYGNYGKIISNIKSHAPTASIVMLSVARPYERVLDPNIKEIAEHFEIPYIYLPDDWFFRSQYFRDTMYLDHPRVYGYGGMAKAVRRLLEKAIKTNSNYFSNYSG